jgi:D-sedoheptulose 7-phosphate isomerase
MNPTLQELILKSSEESVRALSTLQETASLLFMEESATMIADAFINGGKLVLAGNGGSACDAAHCAEEFTGIFRRYRQALPAIALTDPGHITCTGNDLGFDWIFARGIEAYGKPGDVFIGLTTSGKSPNIVKAFEAAQRMNLKTIAFLGKGGGSLRGVADLELCIDGFPFSDRIQEVHMAALHIIIEAVEALLFPEAASLSAEPQRQSK